MLAAGHGAHGIVYGWTIGEPLAHFFNVVNQNGVVGSWTASWVLSPIWCTTTMNSCEFLIPGPSEGVQMVTREQATALMEAYANAAFPLNDESDRYLVLREKTVERPYGWVVYYAPRRFLETGNPDFLPAGCVPFLVQKADGKLIPLGGLEPLDFYLRQYEEGSWPPMKPGVRS